MKIKVQHARYSTKWNGSLASRSSSTPIGGKHHQSFCPDFEPASSNAAGSKPRRRVPYNPSFENLIDVKWLKFAKTISPGCGRFATPSASFAGNRYNALTMDVTVLTHPEYRGMAEVKEAVAVVNELQTDFILRLEHVDWLPNGAKEIDPKDVARLVRKNHAGERVVALIRAPLKGDYFDYPSKGLNIVSTAQWEKHFAPPPLKVYIVFQFAYALGAFVATLPYQQLKRLIHKKPRGCVFDASVGRAQFRLSLVAAYLCAECEASLSEWGVTDKQLESLGRVLSYVRDFAIRRPRARSRAVFIGHGRRKDWEQVRDRLTTLGIEVDEFNVDPTAGITTVERLTHMLDRACFAILVMTAEDKQADGRVNARQNVVHEIGLFQGKLGFQKSIIVMEKRVGRFSNIDGLTYIPYAKGKIARAFPEIERALRRERVIQAPAGVSTGKAKGHLQPEKRGGQ